MSFTVKHTRSDRPIVAEYLCPVHGRFTLEVPRDEAGDPPSSAACRCGATAAYAISAPRVRVRLVEAVRGGYQKAEVPTWTDTTNLGEGQDLDDWIADRDKVWEANRQREIKELLA